MELFYKDGLQNGGINIPYSSDLKPWRERVLISRGENKDHHFDDGGLYTGETILHVLIAKQDLSLSHTLSLTHTHTLYLDHSLSLTHSLWQARRSCTC